jgi:hypothetical protein
MRCVRRTSLLIVHDAQRVDAFAELIANRFNVLSYLRGHSFIVPPVLYLCWILIVASLKTALGEWWMHGVVVLNWVCFSAGVYTTLTWIRHSIAFRGALLLAAALFFVAADLLIFVPFVLSDLTFWGLSTTVVVIGLHVAASDDPGTVRRLWIGTILTAIALIFRPVALPLALFWIVAIVVRVQRDRVVRLGPMLIGMLCAMAMLAVMAQGYLLMNLSAWPGKLPAMFELLNHEYREGVLVYSPNGHFSVGAATSWSGFTRITVEKWIYFCTPWLPHYSAAHTAMNLAFFAPVYFLSAAAVLRSRRLSPSQQLSVWMLTSFAVLASSFHAIAHIDYDHRYRLPLLPVLIMLASFGLEAIRRPQVQRDASPTES